ncbi:unnamed protein product [Vitrella brassicaformis CCMP3155]|uniref:BolA family transcriptional regulator n=2 Tax=Vitrella brassicaformis TaxID=1169539 RepID=A0A0G4GGT8_VITBC|nr:unnamed protein product [Vitrella brassicaformis CCMP3155]|eukprot:CEM28666.1 unnamed protein product [Vitrella brassicaformis CCMP3155]
MGPVYDAIERKLTEELSPTSLEIVDESAGHADHLGMQEEPHKFAGGETHFRIDVTSEMFEGLSRVKRHQLVYKILDEEIKNAIHAISINAQAPE